MSSMCARLLSEGSTRTLSPKELLALRLQEQYPGDVGVLSAWFLNYLHLEAGEAIYLAANEPHAYLSGEIVECMATSDNVIRAGLTPKLRDTGVLCASLTYSQGPPDVMRAVGSGASGGVEGLTRYCPPFREFEVWRYAGAGGSTVQLPAAPGPMLLLVQGGKGRVNGAGVGRGSVFFVAANTTLEVVADEGVTAFFAAANSMGFAQ